MTLRRRSVVASLASPAVQGCAAPLPELSSPGTAPGARALIERSAAAHGLAAFSRFDDLSVSYAGEWPALIGRLQPALVDSGFRGGSEERLLLRGPGVAVAQAHTGPQGRKQVVRRMAAGAKRRPRLIQRRGGARRGTPRRRSAGGRWL